MYARGCCWDNAVEKSFYSTVKQVLNLNEDGASLNRPQQPIKQLTYRKEGYHNCGRRDPKIGHLRPIDDAK
jgi:putative transposase